MQVRRLILSACAFWAILHGASGHLQAQDAEPPLYVALFRFAAGADGKVRDFQTEKVIDLLSGSNDAVPVELPRTFLDRARGRVEAELSKSGARPTSPAGALASFIYVPGSGEHMAPGISFAALSGVMNSTTGFRLLGQDVAISSYGAQSGRSAFFVSYYAFSSLPKASEDQREALVEAEVERSAANLAAAEILSRKDLSTAAQTIVEVTCKSPQYKGLTLRSRYLCNERQTVALTVITPDGASAEDRRAFEQLFDAFRFR